MGCQEEGATPAAAQPHVLLVSCPLQGHVNPLLRLGRRLAARGLLVTFTTFRHAGLHGIHADGTCTHGVRFQYLLGDTTGRDDDAEQMTPDDMLRHAVDAGPAALAALIGSQADAGRPVTCVVNTTFVPWALDVARELGVPCRATLWTQSCTVLSLYYHFYNNTFPDASFPSVADDAPVTLPGLPAMAMDELPLMVRPEFAHNLWGQALRDELAGHVREEEAPPSLVLVNTFHELERAAIDALPIACVPIGPLLDDDDDIGTGDNGVMAWLDAQPPRSVVYVAFGSLVDIGPVETAELAEGLAGAGRPFLWVVRDGKRLDLLPEAVLAACDHDKGKIVAWCPQGRVLGHVAVGCFVTHCGWNSVTEALAAGVPVVGYPWWSDQFTNAKLLVEYGVGVRLPAPVTRDALRMCVDEVMDGTEAATMWERATSWKEEAASAMAHGGSSDRNLLDFVDLIRILVGSCEI
uniref:Uncharacterized protein n=1 Tax=Avena sativa TaxID=4498 RepID=A0ACD5TDY3_AVESA